MSRSVRFGFGHAIKPLRWSQSALITAALFKRFVGDMVYALTSE